MKLKTVTNLVITTTLSVGAFAGAMPKNATLIPAPREIRATGGEYLDKKPPKLEKVAGLPPEGYELRGRVLRADHALPFGALGLEGEVQGLSMP